MLPRPAALEEARVPQKGARLQPPPRGDGYADVIVGAPTNSYGTPRVFAYFGSASGLSATASWTVSGTASSTRFGASVAATGDVNGDGFGDVMVGAPGDNSAAAYVYYGSSTGLSPVANWFAQSDQQYSRFGISVASAGDVNHDGYPDVIIGAPYYGSSNQGAAFVFYGSATGLGPSGSPSNADWRADGMQTDTFLGSAVGTAGDVNGDGYAAVIVGDPYYSPASGTWGGAFVYLGSATGLSSSPTWTGSGRYTLGASVSTAGDVNRDGFSDIIVGEPQWQPSVTRMEFGAAYAYHSSWPVTPSSVTVAGPTWGIAGIPYTFDVTVYPSTVSLPIDYAWTTTDQSNVTHSSVGARTDSNSYTWTTPGNKQIVVSVTNAAGTFQGIFLINIRHRLFLPFMIAPPP
ncbi:MAG: FG-GAP repeat protein [Chloroflexi bacterium]|nr:FG-GAP repeat protein [Chloroflexota bacterium]